ncbi:class I SAM-dependent methyltransferase [Streptomyces sp. NPDC044948]|uniref:class I SAM-dependent methyltransferase n=1 Tax=Streptomyces sp. NPDC044948 TaxID=3157092 RepID=UPI0033DA8DD7
MATSGARQARVRRSWNRDAPWYDSLMRHYDRLLVGDGRSRVCAQAGREVLEVAVGTGRNLPHYPAGAKVVGIDLSPGMLERARPRAAASPATVSLVEASAAALPFADARFDTVVCTLALCCMSDERAAIGGCTGCCGLAGASCSSITSPARASRYGRCSAWSYHF